MKKHSMNALILGSSGLVGHELLELLIMDPRFDKIDLLSRRELDLREITVTNHVVDLDNLSDLPIHHAIDVVFIAFGTTIKKAGTKTKQWEVDVDIPTNVMRMCHARGIKKCVLISSLGVSKNSPFFYSRMKAQLDENARRMGFETLVIVKPSVLDGPRLERRPGERMAVAVGHVFGKTGLFNTYRPIDAIDVAKTMIQGIIELPSGTREILSGEIRAFAKRYTESEPTSIMDVHKA
jgi:uncharacterized protein YbjT (DUF2867 family)